jgi:hypothetical protein
MGELILASLQEGEGVLYELFCLFPLPFRGWSPFERKTSTAFGKEHTPEVVLQGGLYVGILFEDFHQRILLPAFEGSFQQVKVLEEYFQFVILLLTLGGGDDIELVDFTNGNVFEFLSIPAVDGFAIQCKMGYFCFLGAQPLGDTGKNLIEVLFSL